jgi:glycosyltransferase involved in cell wall biosynthesis
MNKKILLVIPVYNEKKILVESIKKLENYLTENIIEDWIIIIANNASTDKTKEIAEELTKKHSKIKAIHLAEKGRGNALKYVWTNFKADIYAYCDVDLATDISNLKNLFDSMLEGNNIVIGSRYLKDSKTKRAIGRLILSKVYIFLIKIFFKTKLNDFQCGFKAIDNKIVKEVLPLVQDKEWFFDTELLLLAEKGGYKIKEIPVKWQENQETKVKFIKTILQYLKNLIKYKLNNDKK